MKNKKNIIFGIFIIVTVCALFSGCTKKEEVELEDNTKIEVPKIKIVDTDSKTRPYAVVINNTPVAVKVQEGVNKAYLVYEIPTEGFTSRLLAFYKDADDITLGTIRSARHNFMDYAHESDAIFVCFGWSHYAQDELNKGGTDFLNGNERKWSSAFWRNNPEKLAYEHTAYTSIKNIKDYVTKNGYRLESDKAEDTVLLNYKVDEVNLDNIEGVNEANEITLPYGNITTVFKYNADTKEYIKNVNGVEIKDHNTKEKVTTKNIIIVKIDYNVASDNKYWNLKNTGTGDGFYITNGKYVPIKWSKETRNSKTKYTYLNGEEIEVNDGRTYIEVHTNKKKVTIK